MTARTIDTVPVASPTAAPNVARSNGQTEDLLKGLTESELTLIHRLAGNDPEVRKATMKKVRKFFKVLATRANDTAESKESIDLNFGRCWKALFYCMWMADKPLPQETLAEQIGNLVAIFSSKPHVMIVFVKWFFVTFVREWPWIDRLRLDKFMMLIRRFLRKMLQEFATHAWDDDLLDQFLNVVTIHLFNHHPLRSKKSARNSPEPPKAPLGFQIHIVNIFLEELAKVGGSELSTDKILKIMSPFVNEMVTNDDDRLLEEIKARIFHHLMKQSDVGIDYVESRGGTLELVELEDEDGEDDHDMDMDTTKTNSNRPLDPRAGQVDVVLPQLDINYQALIDVLNGATNREGIRAKNKKLIKSLAREFEKLTKGQYPLGFEREPKRIPAVKRSEVDSAAQRVLDMEADMKSDKVARMDKKARKKLKNQLAREAVAAGASAVDMDEDTIDGEANGHNGTVVSDEGDDQDAQDTDVKKPNAKATSPKGTKVKMGSKDKVGSSNETKAKGSKIKAGSPSDTKIKAGSPSDTKIKAGSPSDTKIKAGSPSDTKTKKGSKVTTGSPEASKVQEQTPPTKKGSVKKKRSDSVTVSPEAAMCSELELSTYVGDETKPGENAENQRSKDDGDTYIVIKRRRVSDPGSQRQSKVDLTQEQVSAIYSPIILANQERLKRRSLVGSLGLTGKISSASASTTGTATVSPTLTTPKKKVNFVLHRNLEHPHSDYQASIQRSPAIPYDGAKVPVGGLLKTRLATVNQRKSLPAASGRKPISPVPRSRVRASDYFR